MEVSNEELRTVREVVRELGALCGQLERGELDKAVIVTNGRFRAVLISVSSYEALLHLADGGTSGQSERPRHVCPECGGANVQTTTERIQIPSEFGDVRSVPGETRSTCNDCGAAWSHTDRRPELS